VTLTGAVRADREHFLWCVPDGTPAAGAETIAVAKRKELEDFALYEYSEIRAQPNAKQHYETFEAGVLIPVSEV
jgi:hypothetical protein